MLYIFDGKYFLNLYDVIHMGEPKFSNNTIKNELLLKLYDEKMSMNIIHSYENKIYRYHIKYLIHRTSIL